MICNHLICLNRIRMLSFLMVFFLMSMQRHCIGVSSLGHTLICRFQSYESYRYWVKDYHLYNAIASCLPNPKVK
ncbi:MAG: hypothetical protein PWP51_371 [Clostridiales bacterium]|jgi:hypothetical protein|nr:hypothetical protein [Clostridiales bacterium]MDN5297818.1 hypothetical protein [Clostridiales bacterium]